MPSPFRRLAHLRLAPLRPFDRVVAGYATCAFAIAAGESVVVREWSFALLGATLSTAGAVLLVLDHRRWRASQRATMRAAVRVDPRFDVG